MPEYALTTLEQFTKKTQFADRITTNKVGTKETIIEYFIRGYRIAYSRGRDFFVSKREGFL